MAFPRIDPPCFSNKDIQRFWSYVDKSPGQGPNGDCWEWQLKITCWGYGVFWVDHRTVKAHRFSYLVNKGKWSHILILHKCDNRACCNPSHLKEGDHADNSTDMVSKHRQASGDRSSARLYPELRPRGERQHSAKLTEEKVRQCRQMRQEGSTYSAIGKIFHLPEQTIRRAVIGRTWKHVT